MKRRAKKPLAKERFQVRGFVNPSGIKVHRVTGTKLTGERVRENLATYEEALARQQELLIEFGNEEINFRPRITTMPDEQLRDAERALAELPSGKRLVDAVRYYVENYREPMIPMPLTDGREKFVEEKRSANRRPATIRNLKQRIGYLDANLPGLQISDVQPTHLKELIDGKAPGDANNYLRAWSGFFRWSIRNKHREDNPVASVEKPTEDSREIHILSLAECLALLKAAKAYEDGIMVPYVALFLFGGLRHTEIERLRWSKIDFDDGTIRVDDAVAKTRHRRLIEMPTLPGKGRAMKVPNLIDWLEPYGLARKPFVGPTPAIWRRNFDAIKRAAGFGTPTADEPDLKPWVQDIVRHTGITYHLAYVQHEGQTATWAGNSPNIVHTNYKGLVRAKEAAVFWDLRPDNLSAKRKIIRLREAA